MEIIFATHNANKIYEVQQLLPEDFQLRGLSEMNYTTVIAETGTTLDENAWIKANTIQKHFKMNCFADDTGLEVAALNSAPGVYSARFAGPYANAQQNMKKLLSQLEQYKDRRAQFRTVIALHYNNQQWTFEGKVAGVILEYPRGSGGFGYDPIFLPDGFNTSFAEMDIKTKNEISHRGRAFQKLLTFLKANA